VITLHQYFGMKQPPIGHIANANILLAQGNCLLHEAARDMGYAYWICPNTNSQISGSKDGSGDGGYRDADSKTGSPKSSHKLGMGLDVYDPKGELNKWVTDDKLESFGLYREHPSATPTWLHITTRAPKSGHRTFFP
jgi:hypothetical protein